MVITRLAVVIVASVSQRVRLSQGGVAGYSGYVAPSVVVIVCNYSAIFIGYCDYIVLYILYVVIFFAVIVETESIAVVIPQRPTLSGVLLKPLRAWNYPSSCPLSPKGDACWYKLFKNILTEFHIQSDFSLTELNIAIMVIPFNALFVVITTSPPQNTPLFANLCTVLS